MVLGSSSPATRGEGLIDGSDEAQCFYSVLSCYEIAMHKCGSLFSVFTFFYPLMFLSVECGLEMKLRRWLTRKD